MGLEPTPQRTAHRLLRGVCLILALLQLLDLHSSLYAAASGRAETNPLILWAMRHVGFSAAVFMFKFVAVAIIGVYYLVLSGSKRLWWPTISLIPICAACIAVVLNNYS